MIWPAVTESQPLFVRVLIMFLSAKGLINLPGLTLENKGIVSYLLIFGCCLKLLCKRINTRALQHQINFLQKKVRA